MENKWILTNVHERKSYVITDTTLIGIKEYCEIKLWGTNINENDLRFKIRNDKYVSLKIIRGDIKNIKIKINHKLLSKNPTSIRLYNDTYVSIESYIFKVTKIYAPKSLTEGSVLKSLTKRIVCEFQTSQKNNKTERLIAKVQPNIKPLTGRYKNGEMIITSHEEYVNIDLT